jgi:cytoskeletal protein CcmA (bactofilin family)
MSDKNIVSGKHTLVEEGTELKGTISSNCPIVVMGKVDGEITAPIVQVSNSGVVAGKVKVTELRSAGEVAGEIEAETVRISGRVRDKTVIRARTLEVSLSRESGTEVVFGECELAVGDEPNKQAAIEAALAVPAPAPVVAEPAPAPPEPAKPSSKQSQQLRRKGSTESWDESATSPAVPVVETEDEGTPRKRKTLPPPLS